MTRSPIIRIVSLSAVATSLIGALVGCQHQDMLERRTQVRWEHIGDTLGEIENSEASRPKRIEGTLTAVRDKWREHIGYTAQDVDWLKSHQAWELDRWRRNQPEYQRMFDRFIWRGQPENIEANAITLFW